MAVRNPLWRPGGCCARVSVDMNPRLRWLVAVWMGGLVSGGVIAEETLPELLDEAAQAPRVLTLQAEAERARAREDRESAAGGWELFGSAGAGRYDEPVAADIDRRYSGARAAVGVRRPLLGSHEQQQRANRLAQGEAEAAGYRHEQQLQDVRRELAEAYARLWHAQRSRALSRAMLSVEDGVERSLQDRSEQQLMREDEVARLQQTLDVAHMDKDRSAIRVAEARLDLEGLLGRTVVLEQAAAWFDPHELACPRQAVEVVPGVRMLQAKLESAEEREAWTRFGALQSSLQFRYTATYEDDVERSGDGLEVVWTASLPFRALGGGSPLRRELQAEQHQLEYQRLQALRAAQQRLELAERRLAVHQRRLESRTADLERAGRGLRIAQDRVEDALAMPWEGVLPARAEYYRAATAWLDTALEIWLAQIGCERLATEKPRSLEQVEQARQALEERTPRSRSPQEGDVRVYLWQSESAIAQRDPAFWTVLERAGAEHIWLSLDGGQINQYADDAEVLERFMSEAQSRGVSVGLLLGEPTWVLPEYRGDLVAIIQSLAHLDFADLHLDIEIDQLDPEADARHDLLAGWLDTVAAAVDVSPWRVGISAHPRDFGDPERCLGCEFAELGVDEIALMIYVTRPETLKARLDPILRREVGLGWVLAQSVERELPEENSWFWHGWDAMQSGLRAALEPLGHRAMPVAIQSYSDLRDMWADEDPL